MTSSADDKRWAIAPPPSPESSAISGEFHLDPRAGQVGGQRAGRRTDPIRRTDAQPSASPRAHSSTNTEERRTNRKREITVSSIHALEPADSDLVTERPPAPASQGLAPRAARPAPEAATPKSKKSRATSAQPPSKGGSSTRRPQGDTQETIPAPSWVDEIDG